MIDLPQPEPGEGSGDPVQGGASEQPGCGGHDPGGGPTPCGLPAGVRPQGLDEVRAVCAPGGPAQQRAATPSGPSLSTPEAQDGQISEGSPDAKLRGAADALRRVLDDRNARLVRDRPDGGPVERVPVEIRRDDPRDAGPHGSPEAFGVRRQRPGVDVVEAQPHPRTHRGRDQVVAGVRGDRDDPLPRSRLREEPEGHLESVGTAGRQHDVLGREALQEAALEGSTVVRGGDRGHDRAGDRACGERRVDRWLSLHTSGYGMTRESRGPITFVTPTGSRLHTFVAALNFGLSGSGVDGTPDGDHCSQGSGWSWDPH